MWQEDLTAGVRCTFGLLHASYIETIWFWF